MTTINAKRQFNDGDIIIIDPTAKAKHGCFVIAILPNTKESTFKEYVMDGGIAYLKPINPQYPLIQFDKKMQVIGVVIGKCEIMV